jgi:hypothetical protein
MPEHPTPEDESEPIEEDVVPGTVPWFISEVPLRGQYSFVKKRRRWPKGTHDQVTRQFLAFAVLGILAALYLISIIALVVGGLDKETFTMAIAAISGPQALAAAVIGFYYGKKTDG